jgi:hypothetical protein
MREELEIYSQIRIFRSRPAKEHARRMAQAWRPRQSMQGLALVLTVRVWPKISLNRRLPRTTQRVVCFLVCEINYSNRTLGETSRWEKTREPPV